MAGTTIHYRAGEEIVEEINLDKNEDMPLRRLGPEDSVTVILQHRRKHDISLSLPWGGPYVSQTGARSVSLRLPVDELPIGGRWAVWGVATVSGKEIRQPEDPRNIRVEQ
jgi:hypothetical protein